MTILHIIHIEQNECRIRTREKIFILYNLTLFFDIIKNMEVSKLL
jgi:hypothetical protein